MESIVERSLGYPLYVQAYPWYMTFISSCISGSILQLFQICSIFLHLIELKVRLWTLSASSVGPSFNGALDKASATGISFPWYVYEIVVVHLGS